MTSKKTLGEMRVKDIQHLIVERPATITPDAGLRELVDKIVEDLRTRNVYVVDAENRLKGYVRMESTLEYLFPLESIIQHSFDDLIRGLPQLSAKSVRDLMSSPAPVVRESTDLGDMVRIMMREKTHELAVVDSGNRLIGEVNVFELIKAFQLKK